MQFNSKKHTLIIAEAGVNHNGSIELAKELIDVAAQAGADYVKFQTFKAERIATRQAQKAEYQKKSGDNESQFDLLKRLELDVSIHQDLMDYCDSKNIKFMSTPFDTSSVVELHDLGLETFKVSSGDVNNLPLLRTIGEHAKQVIFSTGMSTMDEVRDCVRVLMSTGLTENELAILHCNTQYPTPFGDVNLNAMNSIRQEFPNVQVGYSDHTLGIEVPLAAVAMGATIIEKHFTTDKDLPGPDHAASLNPDELKSMVSGIRNLELAFGHADKVMSASEAPNRELVRKSIVAADRIVKGEILSENNLTTKRPGNGISPMEWDAVIGTLAKRDYEIDEQIDP